MGNRCEKIQTSNGKKKDDFWKLNEKYHAVVKRGKGLGSMLSLAGSKTCSIKLNGIIRGHRGGCRRTQELTSIPRQYFIEETRSTLHEGN
ncbi:hypothetical protein HZH68_002920 [Vespula germanica]|uniref:Uncharacterized protein n=1 Tax=Vespula germanica TaxID=30212 RepID=A0A834U221_VESGE|nr:hypothetical protein HZH68_002920 [Vespula germanica]